MINNIDRLDSMTIKREEIYGELPDMPEFVEGIRRAPKRDFTLSQKETELALKNAWRYIPEKETRMGPLVGSDHKYEVIMVRAAHFWYSYPPGTGE